MPEAAEVRGRPSHPRPRDSVPVTEKAQARALVRESLEALAADGQDRSVRINGLETRLALDDLEAIVCPAL